MQTNVKANWIFVDSPKQVWNGLAARTNFNSKRKFVERSKIMLYKLINYVAIMEQFINFNVKRSLFIYEN